MDPMSAPLLTRTHQTYGGGLSMDIGFSVQGEINFPNGDKYVGAILDRTPHGQGTLTYSSFDERNRSQYVGNFEHGKRHGHETLRWAPGDDKIEYVGEFQNDQIHGHGRLRWTVGVIYDGEWRSGLRHGRGTLTETAISTILDYVGDFEDDHKQGQGVMRWKDGSSYNGQFKLDLLHGYGRYINNKLRITHTGMFENDEAEGPGTRETFDGLTNYSGIWHKGKFWEGNVSSRSPTDGRLYTYQYKDGERYRDDGCCTIM